MKKKEREHLKEDPFANFIQSVLDIFQDFKKEIITITGVLILIVIIIITVLMLRSGSIDKDNIALSSAIEIWNSSSMTTGEKIEKLSELKKGKGLSSSAIFYTASLYYKLGEYEKAKDVLSEYRNGSIKLMNDQKKLLEAEILIALNEGKTGLDIFQKLLSDSKSEISKDFLLLKIAKINIKDGLKKSARENLNRLMNEFPQSIFSREAGELLSGLSE